jgi:serine/threonine-protein kinase
MPPGPEQIGDYVIEGELGAGGMAKVYRARHPVLGTRHAIKVLDPAYRENPAARQRFLDEARIQARHLDHDNIVKVTNIIATDEHAALVMELIEGGSLESRLGALKDQPGEIRRIMLAVLDAVGHAHAEGIIHRDLKPANVLLDTDGEPKVTDFGIAKVMAGSDTKKSTAADARMGTLSYMSPEQIRRAKDVTARSDIFSLGAMLYEMATGRLAFAGESDYDVMDAIIKGNYPPPTDIDPVFIDVITVALDPDPAKRYASCAEMAEALRAEKPRPVVPPPPPEIATRSYGMLIGVLGGIVMIGGGAAYVATRPDTPAVTAIDAGMGPVAVPRPPAIATVPDDCVGTWSGEVPPDNEIQLQVPGGDPTGTFMTMWDPRGRTCFGTGTNHRFADGTLSGPFTCPDAIGSYELTCTTGTARISMPDQSGRGLTHTIAMTRRTGASSPPPPVTPPPKKNGALAYCMSGFAAGVPSPCEQKRPLHKRWHLHGYLEGDGACFECWDEEDDDCQTAAPKRTGFRYLGSSCNGVPPATEGNVREATVSSTTRSTPRSVPTVPSVPTKPNPYDRDGLLTPF